MLAQIRSIGGARANRDDQIEIEGAGDRPVSDGGDSGSLIVVARGTGSAPGAS